MRILLQTNEVGRYASIWPFLPNTEAPIALVEVGHFGCWLSEQLRFRVLMRVIALMRGE